MADNRGILEIIFGGLIVSLFNKEINRKEEDDWDINSDLERYRSFSEQVEKKRDGYRIKYRVDDSFLRPKYINLRRENDYIFYIEKNYKKNPQAIESLELEGFWQDREKAIGSMMATNLYEGLIFIKAKKTEYWLYCVEVEADDLEIVISDGKEKAFRDLKKFLYFYDDFICLDLEEARKLAKAMESYYHNFNKRVRLVEDLDNKFEKWKIYNQVFTLLGKIKDEKYKHIKNVLEETSFEKPLYGLYSLMSLGIQLYMDGYYKESLGIFDMILSLDEKLLVENKLKGKIYKNILSIYIAMEDEDKLINLIKSRYREDYKLLHRLAEELHGLELFQAGEFAYSLLIENHKPSFVTDIWERFELYKKLQDDEGLRIWRNELYKQGKDTWRIDRYLRHEDPEGLEIKIEKYEKEKNWEKVIEYCNQYNKLVLIHPWKTMDKRIEYEFKKIDAYINKNEYKAAWNSACKTRSILLANFEEIDHFDFLSRAEAYMKKISIHKECFLDGLYYYIMEKLYKDIYAYYKLDEKLDWEIKEDESLKQLLEKLDLAEIGFNLEDMEEIIKNEYENFSEKSIRNISGHLNDILLDKDHKLILNKPKKYYPKLVARDFKVKEGDYSN